jgi:predicted PurR-regulated permease PerM
VAVVPFPDCLLAIERSCVSIVEINVMRPNPIGSPPVATAPTGPSRRRWRDLSPVGLLVVLLLFYFVIKIGLVVELALLSVMYATLIEQPVRAIERHGLSRRVAIVSIDVALVAGLVIPVMLLAPAAGREFNRFRKDEPVQLRALDASWRTSSNPLLRGPGRQLVERGISVIEQPSAPPKTAVSVARRVLGTVLGIIICLTIAFYYLMEKDLLHGLLLDTVNPGSRPRVERLWAAAEYAVGGWLRGRLLLGLIAGILTTIVFGLLGLPYWPLLGLLAGITEPVPILGPWIGGIPAVFLALTESFWLALFVAGFILIRQVFADTVLVPHITKETLGLSPLVVFVAVLTGTELMGWVGALLSIPIAAVIQVFVSDYFATRRAAELSTASLAPTWRWWRSGREGPPEPAESGNKPHDS